MSAQPTLLGSRGLAIGAARSGSKALLIGGWKKRLPTIAEADGEDQEEVRATASATSKQSQPTSTPLHALAGLPDSLADPLSIITNDRNAAIVVQRLKDGSKADRRQLFAWLLKALPTLALSEAGSKVVQLAFEVATGPDRTMIASSFYGNVLELSRSANGHAVLVTLIQTMPVSSIAFIVNEIEGRATEVSRDRFGSCVLEALAMHCSEEQMAPLATELADQAVELSRHPSSSSVIQHLLEYTSSECRTAIVQRLIPEAACLAMHRTATHVIDKALRYCNDEDQQALVMAFLEAKTPISVVDIACSRCGSSILEEVSNIDVAAADFKSRLAAGIPRLAKSKFGRKVMTHFGLTLQKGTEATLATSRS